MEANVNTDELLNTLPDAILLVARDGNIVSANNAACRLLNREKTELTNVDIGTVVLEPAQKILDYLNRCARNGSFTVGLFTFQGATGDAVPCQCEGARLSGGRSPLILLRQTPRREATTAFIALNEQVTNLNRARHQLEGEVRSRTAKLLEAEAALRKLSTTLMQVQDEERRRVARELHDSAGQLLTAVQLTLSLVHREDLSPQAKSRITEAIDLTNQATSEVRVISHLLHPPLLDEEGLPLALQTFVEGFQERSGITMCFAVSGSVERSDRDVETAVFRIVQESLTNIHRHSGSKMAEVLLRAENDALTLTIRDYGTGMQADAGSGRIKCGVGIRGIQERVRLLGGTIDITAAEPGLRVFVQIPYVGRKRHAVTAAVNAGTAADN